MEERLRGWVDFYANRYVGMIERFENYVRTRDMKFTVLTLEEARRRKKSDTIFLLGSGPSINQMTESAWREVARHDSLAINLFILHPFVPTFYHTEVSKNPRIRGFFMEVVRRRRKDYSNTVVLVHPKSRRYGMHPRFCPGLFPERPIVCFPKFPKIIQVPASRPFAAADFKESMIYRGTMNNAIYLACELGFQNIVLLGVDLKTNEYFYDDFESVQWMKEIKGAPVEERKKHPYGMDHIPEIGKSKHSYPNLYYALRDFVLNPRGIRLSVGSTESLLHPKIPLYPWPA